MGILGQVDHEIAHSIENEEMRQRRNLVLIASENYTSMAVQEAQGSVMSNKYAEGYPGRRYYGGCEYVDVAETIAIDRLKRLFGAQYANVQPHSGAQANMAAYAAILEPGDTVLGMRLDQGGHLTHGSRVNFSGKLYNFVSYGVTRDAELIDYEEMEKLAKKHGPKVIVAGATAYPRTIDFARFRAVADEVGALLMVDIAHISGLIAAGAHPSCVSHAQIITSTTYKTLRGPRGAFIISNEELAPSIDKAVFPFTQGGPMMHTIAAKAVAFGEALKPEFSDYGHHVVENARTLAKSLEDGGLRIVSGGTDNHLILVDLTTLGITGQEAEDALGSSYITANKNAIPFDTRPPRVTSGLRLGTPALTTRGFRPQEMVEVARLIVKALTNIDDDSVAEEVRMEVMDLTSGFPVPSDELS